MKRALIIGLSAVGGLLALLVVAAVVLAFTLDPNDYRDRIEAMVADRTGRELAIEGDIGLSYFPWLGAEVGRTRLGNAKGFGPDPFARIEAIDVRVRVLPLLWGEVAVGSTVLRGLEVRLTRDEQGRTNWEDLVPEAEPGAPSEPAPGPEGPPAGPMAGLTLGGLEVRDALLVWNDRQAGQEATISDLQLTVGALRPGTSFPVDGRFQLRAGPPETSGELRLEGRAGLSEDGRTLRLEGLTVSTDLAGPGLPGGKLRGQLAATGAYHLGPGRAVIDSARLTTVGTELTVTGEATDLNRAARFEGRLEARVTDPEQAGQALGALPLPASAMEGLAMAGDLSLDTADGSVAFQEGALEGPGLEGDLRLQAKGMGASGTGRLDLEVVNGKGLAKALGSMLPEGIRGAGLNGAGAGTELRWSQTQDTAALSGLKATLGPAQITGGLELRGLTSESPSYRGRLATNAFSPRELLQEVGLPEPDTADPDVLQRAKLQVSLSGTPTRLAAEELTAELDESRLTGSASVATASPLQVAFDLALNRMDIDRYLPPTPDGNGQATPGTAAAAGAEELPVEPLRGVNADGKVRAGRLKVQDLRLTDLNARLKGSEGKFRLHPFTATLYEGGYQGDVRLDVTGDKPRISVTESLSQVSLGALLKDLTGRSYVDGQADLDVDLSGNGATVTELLQNLGGKGEIRLRNGAIQGIDIGRALSAGYAALQGDKASADSGGGTDFRELRASARLEGGRLLTRSLSIDSQQLGLNGEGALELLTGKLDYKLDAQVKKGAQGLPQALQGLQVPVRLKGTWADPKIQPDIKGALQRALGQKGKEKAREKLDEGMEKQVPEGLRDKAKDLLNF